VLPETRKALLGHATRDLTTHHSAAELRELHEASERIRDRGGETPALSVVGRRASVGRTSEKETGLAMHASLSR
jgi:hypothetical protein